MINWIQGEIISTWQNNNKFFVLINCNGLGYEIQILESIYIKLKTNQISINKFTLWLKHIKKEDSDSLYGFISKVEKDFFNEILSIKGIGAQIGMAMLNKLSVDEIKQAIVDNDKSLIGSIQGIGQKMTERIILELKSKLKSNPKNQVDLSHGDLLEKDKELISIFEDLELTLQSLNYPRKEIKEVFPMLIKTNKNNPNQTDENNNLSFENLLKEAMTILDRNSSNLGQ